MIPMSSAELAAMQAAAQSAMDLAATIQRATRTPDGMGGFSESYAVVSNTVCTLAQPSGTLLQNYDYLVGSLSAWLVHLPYGANVKEGDRLLVGGMTLKVQVLLANQSYPTDTPVLAAEVQ